MVIPEIVGRQREYFKTGATRSFEFRLDSLKKLQKALKNNEGAISEAMKKDLNKHRVESYMCETGLILDELRYCIKHLEEWTRSKTVPTPPAQFKAKSYLVPEPYGVVLIMSPWNYPVQLCIMPLIGAICAGNCAIVKPSIYAEATSHVLEKMLSEIFPREYVAVIEGGRKENSSLLEEKFEYIFFTGSVEVGKTVMQAAAKNLTPVTLELGGKSPVIIDKTADIRMAARRVAFGKVLNAGQTCVAPDYLLIEESVCDDFIKEYRLALKRFFPRGDMSDMTTIISDKHYTRKKKMLEGQKAVIGGGYDDSRLFIEPTVLVHVDPGSLVMQEEIFAPILPVLTWTDLQEAISFVQARPKPLALYLFTKDSITEKKVMDSCSFGGGCINDTIIHLANHHMGFGGIGDSGMGKYHGKYSYDMFTNYRSVVKKSTWIDLPLRNFPYKKLKFRIIKIFLR